MPGRLQCFIVCALAGLFVWGCDGALFGPGTHTGLEYVVERFEVVEEPEGWAPFPIGYLKAQVAVVNVLPDTQRLGYGACSLELEGQGPSDDGHRSAWRSSARALWPWTMPIACAAYLKTAHLGPGDTLRAPELNQEFRLADILADSLSAGSYDFEAVVQVGPAARVALGEIHLPVTRFPLPEWVAHRDGFRYEIALDPDGGEVSVRLDVSFSAPTAQVLERTISADCPLQIVAFRTSTDRATIPRPEPVWTWPSICSMDGETVRLGPGDARAFEWTLTQKEMVAHGASPGAYFLMGIITVDKRPIRLSVGELQVD